MSIANQTYTRLIVDELQGFLYQDFTLTKTTVIDRIMPHLYIQAVPAGTVSLRICEEGNLTNVLASCELDLVEAATAAGKIKTYYHGYISFQFPSPPILKAGTYTIELAAGSYTFDENVFVGWVKLPSDASQTYILTHPHDLQIVEVRRQ